MSIGAHNGYRLNRFFDRYDRDLSEIGLIHDLPESGGFYCELRPENRWCRIHISRRTKVENG